MRTPADMFEFTEGVAPFSAVPLDLRNDPRTPFARRPEMQVIAIQFPDGGNATIKTAVSGQPSAPLVSLPADHAPLEIEASSVTAIGAGKRVRVWWGAPGDDDTPAASGATVTASTTIGHAQVAALSGMQGSIAISVGSVPSGARGAFARVAVSQDWLMSSGYLTIEIGDTTTPDALLYVIDLTDLPSNPAPYALNAPSTGPGGLATRSADFYIPLSGAIKMRFTSDANLSNCTAGSLSVTVGVAAPVGTF